MLSINELVIDLTGGGQHKSGAGQPIYEVDSLLPPMSTRCHGFQTSSNRWRAGHQIAFS
jgi:hypothetical protein